MNFDAKTNSFELDLKEVSLLGLPHDKLIQPMAEAATLIDYAIAAQDKFEEYHASDFPASAHRHELVKMLRESQQKIFGIRLLLSEHIEIDESFTDGFTES